jgi:hypothetical protein
MEGRIFLFMCLTILPPKCLNKFRLNLVLGGLHKKLLGEFNFDPYRSDKTPV